MIRVIIAAISGCICEYFALIEILDTPNWLIAILLHALASALFTCVSYIFFPLKYKTTLLSSAFIIIFIIIYTPCFWYYWCCICTHFCFV